MSVARASPSPPPLRIEIPQRPQTPNAGVVAAPAPAPAAAPPQPAHPGDQPLARSGSQLSRNGSKRKPPPRVDSLHLPKGVVDPAPDITPVVEYVARPTRSDSLPTEHRARPTPIEEEPGSGTVAAEEEGMERLHVTWVEVGRNVPLQEMDVNKLAPVVQKSPMKRAFSLTRSGSKGKADKQGVKLGRASSERLKETASFATRPSPHRANSNPPAPSHTPPTTLARSTSSNFRARAALLAAKLTPTPSPSSSAFSNTPQPPQHFAPPTFSPAEVAILRTQLAAAGQALLEAGARERELQSQLAEAGEQAKVGRGIMWTIIAERDAQEAAAKQREEELKVELQRAEAERFALIKSHTYTLASMQREIDALHSAWLKASPGSAPPLPTLGAPIITTQDFPSGPMSDEDGHEPVAQASAVRTPHSTFGLFRAEEPVGEWEEGEALSRKGTKGA